MSSGPTDHDGHGGRAPAARRKKTNHFPCSLRVRIALEAMERLRRMARRGGTSLSRVVRDLVSHAP